VLEPSFDPARALQLIAEERITTMMGVPATYLFLSEEPGFAEADLSSLRLVVVGGAPMPAALLETWQARGVEIVQGYGLTEAAPNVLCLPPEDARRKLGFAGKPYPHVDVALRDPDTGRLLEARGVGELLVRGPNVFAGYWDDPSATETAFVSGWLRTKDLAERDDEGFYRIVGRLEELVISGGENVYPAEVEDVLHAHPDVVEAAVVGVPDVRWGEVCAAFVVLRERAETDEDELRDHCGARLARFKVPRTVTIVEKLPRSSMGKVLKDQLRASATGAAR
jgi:fatty-acyl-CoA synthase